MDKKVKLAVIVASLGYFVDVFDIVLFNMVRVDSFNSLGIDKKLHIELGLSLLSYQLYGMLLGGFIWGVLGDKLGRIKVLFGSILLYSIGNILNAFVWSVPSYAVCRFISGIGLAGEIGAGVTLVVELMKKSERGIGTAILAASGTFGAVAASLSGQFLDWRVSYLIGGGLGLILLLLRFNLNESGLFNNLIGNSSVSRGSLKVLFCSKVRLKKYLICILAGLPLFFSYYVQLLLSPEIGEQLNIPEKLITAKAAMYGMIGMTIGDLCCGFLSQYLKSRKKAFFIFVFLGFPLSTLLTTSFCSSAFIYYTTTLAMGFFMGYWAVYLATAAEQFGTNIRATVATTIPNLVRASPIIFSHLILAFKDTYGLLISLQIVGTLAYFCSLFFISRLQETFDRDLDFLEEN